MENDQFPNRDRSKASPLASPQQPMDHVFLRGQIHQKLFGRSPRDQDSATRFYRYRRAVDPSSFFKSRLGCRVFLRMHRPRLQPGQAELMQPCADSARMHVYREPPLHDAMEIRDPPAHHLIRGQISPSTTNWRNSAICASVK